MLAYLFWHAPRRKIPPARYEALLSGFHQALASDPPETFLGSTCHRLDTIPWLGHGPGYEDRYFLTGSEGLDRLNAAAVDTVRSRLHGAVAELSETGAGGLYRRLRPGFLDAGREGEALWMQKPPGISSADVVADLEGRVPEEIEIWQRQLVLGPAPELCLLGPPDVFSGRRLPGGDLTVLLRRHPVWPAPMDAPRGT